MEGAYEKFVIFVQRLALFQQELSYRKQIARKLRTQYFDGTHGPKYYTVTLKSRLRVMTSRSLETEPLDRSYTTYY